MASVFSIAASFPRSLGCPLGRDYREAPLPRLLICFSFKIRYGGLVRNEAEELLGMTLADVRQFVSNHIAHEGVSLTRELAGTQVQDRDGPA